MYGRHLAAQRTPNSDKTATNRVSFGRPCMAPAAAVWQGPEPRAGRRYRDEESMRAGGQDASPSTAQSRIGKKDRHEQKFVRIALRSGLWSRGKYTLYSTDRAQDERQSSFGRWGWGVAES